MSMAGQRRQATDLALDFNDDREAKKKKIIRDRVLKIRSCNG